MKFSALVNVLSLILGLVDKAIAAWREYSLRQQGRAEERGERAESTLESIDHARKIVDGATDDDVNSWLRGDYDTPRRS